MPDIFVLIIFLLFALAIFDLVVGVSNDAVNFLNSAIGSRVASRRLILTVASLGILLGASFASGMMEIARKGIFNPDLFVFADVMIIFLAVMITDIILLDLFNTLGLPTSTTVSIVFELLGASLAVAAIKLYRAGEGWEGIGAYINSSSALTIILGIFLSIAIAFTVGMVIMYLSRLLFTFHYESRLNWLGSVWAGLALSIMSYFLLIKGIKGASFVPEGFTGWVLQNTLALLGGSFLLFTLLMQLLLKVFRINILRIIVLFGTFALAMAFAGNDLVNFIGVPLAGLEAFWAWQGSGQAAGDFSMSIFHQDFPTHPLLLLGAGIIMLLTLWFSRKARTVTETEVNLGRQHEGIERFSPNWLSQFMVRGIRQIGNGMRGFIPNRLLEGAEANFQPRNPEPSENGRPQETPAFDLVRAAVNLSVASALIAMATSYKLPLSTTYVTFMVAMGSSLADRAWGRDSAVYRVAGVINVIGGWFVTALLAFAFSGLFAFLIHQFGLPAIIVLIAVAAIFLTRTFLLHRKKEKDKLRREAALNKQEIIHAENLMSDTFRSIIQTLESVKLVYSQALEGLEKENLLLLREADQSIRRLRQQQEEFKYLFYSNIRRLEEPDGKGSRVYILAYDLEQDILQSIEFIVRACQEHVRNSHTPLKKGQQKRLADLQTKLHSYLHELISFLNNPGSGVYPTFLDEKKELLAELEAILHNQVDGIKKHTYNARNSLLFFSLILETKDLVAVAARFGKLYYRAQKSSGASFLLHAPPQTDHQKTEPKEGNRAKML